MGGGSYHAYLALTLEDLGARKIAKRPDERFFSKHSEKPGLWKQLQAIVKQRGRTMTETTRDNCTKCFCVVVVCVIINLNVGMREIKFNITKF